MLELDDLDELYRRLDERVARAPTDWGGKPEEKELVARLHRTKAGHPENAIVIKSMTPIADIVDEILRRCDYSQTCAITTNLVF